MIKIVVGIEHFSSIEKEKLERNRLKRTDPRSVQPDARGTQWKCRNRSASVYRSGDETSPRSTITDARVLRPEFAPSEVEHRNQEVDALSNALKPIVDRRPGETSLLLGPSDAGKTGIAQFTLERLRENVLDINAQSSPAGGITRGIASSLVSSKGSTGPLISIGARRPSRKTNS